MATKPTVEFVEATGRWHCFYLGHSVANFPTQGEANAFQEDFRSHSVIASLEPAQIARCLTQASADAGNTLSASTLEDMFANHTPTDLELQMASDIAE